MKVQAPKRKVLVTGGCAGIGLAMVARFLDAGYRVGVVDKDVNLASNIINHHKQVDFCIRADVSVGNDIDAALRSIESEWNEIDVLLNNAGVSLREDLLNITSASWDYVMNSNLKGAFFMAQQCAKLMLGQASGGCIINTASVSGMVAMPGYLQYNISKAAVIHMTRCMALELAPRVRVNSISPGYIMTPMQSAEYSMVQIEECASKLPLQRLGKPCEIADMALFLASSQAGFITGQNFVVDGGEITGGLASL